MTGLGIFIAAFALAYIGTTLLLRIPLKGRFVDVPNERSSHDTVKPRFGGIAIFASFLAVTLYLLVAQPDTLEFLPLLVGGGLIFIVGLLDDWRSLPVWVRFGAQIVAAGILVVTGNVVDHIFLPLVGTIDLDMLAIPFTVLFVMASINFYNFIDGIDGLAAGSAFIIAGFLALISYMLGHTALALVCLALAGSSVGFLQFNFPPSRLFMGDGGSTFLGYFFAFVAVSGNRMTPEIPFFITVLMVSSLYLDAGLTLVLRAFRGEKVLKPHHTHYYQRLLSLGLNHKQVTFLEYGVTILLGVSALIFFKAGGFFPIFVCVCWFAVFASLIMKIRSLERGDRVFWERRTLLVVGSDVLVVALAYFAAFFIRMNFQKTDPHWEAVLKAFPIVLVVRSASFYWFGLYRSVWKYTSTPDVVRIIKAVTAGSAIVIALLVFFYRFDAFPRSMFIIEYFLLIAAIGGTRFASRLFHEFGKEAVGGESRRIAIVGAGDHGERLLREIRNTEGKRVSVVCFVDDDKQKEGLTLQGVPIKGPIERLDDICEDVDADTVVIGISNPPPATVKSVVQTARKSGLKLETRNGLHIDTSSAPDVVFDKISQRLGRTLPLEPAENARTFFTGKRVLVTNGGETIGPALVRELSDLGADVAVHVNSPWESERFQPTGEKSVRFFAGALEREIEAAAVINGYDPQVIFHAVAIRARGMENEADVVWKRVVRAAESLCKCLEKSTVDSLVVLFFWEETPAEGFWSSAAALAETLVLNNSQVLHASPKSIRLPLILTNLILRDSIRSGDKPAADSDRRFGILEPEAVALAINACAGYKGRVIAAPKTDAGIDFRTVLKMFNVPVSGDKESTEEPTAPLFPGETARPSVVRGASEIISPVYPASGALRDALSACMYSSGNQDLQKCIEMLNGDLFEKVVDERIL
jgi:UDP-GlcNAc:undecaprenyl-phosphate GlcNAc-1-phosphate transferase